MKDESAQKWLDELYGILGTATTELKDEDFPRMNFNREFVDFTE